MAEPRDATAATAAKNRELAVALPLDDPRDAELAERGHVAPLPGPVPGPDGSVAWDPDAGGAFLGSEAPPEVNPSLWRQARLNARHGLFEVADGIYQVRGADVSNITFVAGETGWIVIDPLTTAETARAALALVTEHARRAAGQGGASTRTPTSTTSAALRGIVSDEDLAAGLRIIAPDGFLEAAVSENVIAGPGHGPARGVHVRRPAPARSARPRGRGHRHDACRAARRA